MNHGLKTGLVSGKMFHKIKIGHISLPQRKWRYIDRITNFTSNTIYRNKTGNSLL